MNVTRSRTTIATTIALAAALALPLIATADPDAWGVPIRVGLSPVDIDAGEWTDLEIDLDNWTGGGKIDISYQMPAGVKPSDVFSNPVYSANATSASVVVPLQADSGYLATISVTIKAEYEGESDTGQLNIN